MHSAKIIKRKDGWTGEAFVCELSHPVRYFAKENVYSDGLTTDVEKSTIYVIVSATTIMYESETMIFPADEYGEPINFFPLFGSLLSVKDHERALKNAGYELENSWMLLYY
jgi:hypothetical protein